MANNKISFDRFYTKQITQKNNFIYKDLHAFRNNRVNTTNDIDIVAIYNSLKNLMEFKNGQRILDFNFGNPLYGYLYNSMATTFEIKSVLQQYIEKYEPRIKISNINVEKNEEEHEIFLNVQYTILNEDEFTDEFSIRIGDNING